MSSADAGRAVSVSPASARLRVRTFDSAEAFLEEAGRESIGCVVLDRRCASRPE
jgi:FixJ family two-component response regulator